MSHFSPADWVDFTRGLLPAPEATALQSHLDRQCQDCLASKAIWQTVSECLSQEAQYRPPQKVLEGVRAAYAHSKPWRWLAQVAHWAELIFDSLNQPVPALVRGSRSSTRQLVHQAGSFVIDVRLESDLPQNRMFLIGQILNSEDPDEEMQGVDVLLLSGEDLVGRTKASSSGEFELECKPDRNLRLFINISGYRAIGITVPDM